MILLAIMLLALLVVACQEPERPAGGVRGDIGVLEELEVTSAYFTEILSVQGSTPTPRPTRTPTATP